jgi:hypothetical protein
MFASQKNTVMNKMYEMSQLILQRVSFDKTLFRKEFTKAMKWLKPKERALLYVWCLTQFGMYRDVIFEGFQQTVTKS